jgi:hypothetical protein
MTQYASIAHEKAFLFTARGEALARHKFGDAAVDALPKFTSRSKHAGKPKGLVTLRRVIAGGWVRLEQRVERRVGQIITAELRELPKFGEDSERVKVLAQWSADHDAARDAIERDDAFKLAQDCRQRSENWAQLHFDAIGVQGAINYRLNQRARLASEGL